MCRESPNAASPADRTPADPAADAALTEGAGIGPREQGRDAAELYTMVKTRYTPPA